MNKGFLVLLSLGAAFAQAPVVTGVGNGFIATAGVSPGAYAAVYGNDFGTDKTAVSVTVFPVLSSTSGPESTVDRSQ